MPNPSDIQDYEAIIQVVRKYTDGNQNASSATMRPAFHPQATIFGLDGDAVFGPEIEKLFDLIDQFEPSPEARAVVSRIDIAGTAASVRLDCDRVAGQRFTDFFNLLKVDGAWVIVNKTYCIYPKA